MKTFKSTNPLFQQYVGILGHGGSPLEKLDLLKPMKMFFDAFEGCSEAVNS